MITMNLFCKDEETSQNAEVTIDFPLDVDDEDEFGTMLEYCAACELPSDDVKRLIKFINRIRFADESSSDVQIERDEYYPYDTVFNVDVTPDDLSFLLTCAAALTKCLFDELINQEINRSLCSFE